MHVSSCVVLRLVLYSLPATTMWNVSRQFYVRRLLCQRRRRRTTTAEFLLLVPSVSVYTSSICMCVCAHVHCIRRTVHYQTELCMYVALCSSHASRKARGFIHHVAAAPPQPPPIVVLVVEEGRGMILRGFLNAAAAASSGPTSILDIIGIGGL